MDNILEFIEGYTIILDGYMEPIVSSCIDKVGMYPLVVILLVLIAPFLYMFLALLQVGWTRA